MATEARGTIEQQAASAGTQEIETERATFALEGMTCTSCAMRIEKGLKKVPGVTNARVNLFSKERSSLVGRILLQIMTQSVGRCCCSIVAAWRSPSVETISPLPLLLQYLYYPDVKTSGKAKRVSIEDD